MHFCLFCSKQCPLIIYPSVRLSTFFLSIYPFIHLNPGRRFYVRPGPQGSAGTQSSSKQCLLSWRRLGLSGQPGCTSLPYVTVKVNDLALATRLREVGLKTGSNMRNWWWQQRGPMHNHLPTMLKCLWARHSNPEREKSKKRKKRKVSVVGWHISVTRVSQIDHTHTHERTKEQWKR